MSNEGFLTSLKAQRALPDRLAGFHLSKKDAAKETAMPLLLTHSDVPPPCLTLIIRCETILQPGFNCTVRIEKNRAKARRRRKKTNNFTHNNVVYKCHFCSHWNRRRGTPKRHMKEICLSKVQTFSKSEPAKSRLQTCASLEKGTRSKDDINKTDEIASPAVSREILTTDSPVTPLVKTATTLLEAKRREKPIDVQETSWT